MAGVWTANIHGAVIEITGTSDGSNELGLDAGNHDISDLLEFTAHQDATNATLSVKDDLTGTALAGYTITKDEAEFNGRDVDLSAVSLSQTTPPVAEIEGVAGVWTANIHGAVIEITGPTDGSNELGLDTGNHDIRSLFTFVEHVEETIKPSELTIKSGSNAKLTNGYKITKTSGDFSGSSSGLTQLTITEQVKPIANS